MGAILELEESGMDVVDIIANRRQYPRSVERNNDSI